MRRIHKTNRKRMFYSIFTLLVVIFFMVPLINIYFLNTPDELQTKDPKDYAIVFGAAIRPQGKLSRVLKNRMDDAITLYKAKKVKTLILSGASYKQMKPGEPKAMRNYAISQGVKKQDILLDERGERTYLTVKYIENLARKNPQYSFVFISSPYHMLRIRLLVFMFDIPYAYFYFTPKNIPIYSKEIFREIFAFWFYAGYRIAYSLR